MPVAADIERLLPKGARSRPPGGRDRARFEDCNLKIGTKLAGNKGFRHHVENLVTSSRVAPPGWRWVFCRSYYNVRAKRRIYAAPGKVFAFLVPE